MTRPAIAPADLGWLVGLFEGEGCIGRSHEGRPSLTIAMTDEDVLRRAHAIAGVGNVRLRPKLTVGGKQMWVWLVGRCDDAAWLLELMRPLLCSRRGARADEMLAEYRAGKPPKRLRTSCPYGHPYAPGRRHCLPCDARRTRAWRTRHQQAA